jgi:hypothetical protein
MNKKILAAVALALVVLGYLALQPKGDTPASVDTDQPASSTTDQDRLDPVPETTELAAEQPGDEAPVTQEDDVAVKLVETLHADKEITEAAVIQSVECAENRCTVELEARGSSNVQSTMLNFLQRHPEYGTSFKVAQGENPKVTQFTFGKEKF